MSHVYRSVTQLKKMLQNLDRWLDKAVDHAKEKNFDAAILLQSRLAPNMFTLTQQIQSACDGAKFAAARLSGKEPPKHPDTEQSLEEVRARLRSVLEYLDTFREADFEGAEGRIIPLGFMPGKGLAALDFMYEMNLPNTYFHLVTAYAILRHNGVDLGKVDFIGPLDFRDL